MSLRPRFSLAHPIRSLDTERFVMGGDGFVSESLGSTILSFYENLGIKTGV